MVIWIRFLMFVMIAKHPCWRGLMKLCFHSFRQSRSRLYLRHHSGRGGPRHHSGVQPGKPESVRLRPGETGLLQPGGRLEVGRMLCWHQVWNWVLSPLRGCPRDQKDPEAPHELTQQWGRKKGREFFFQSSSSVHKICHDNVGVYIMKVSQGICNCVCAWKR